MKQVVSENAESERDALLTVADVQRKLKLSRTTLHKLERAGVLRPLRVSRRCLRYRPAAVQSYIAELEMGDTYRGPGRPRSRD